MTLPNEAQSSHPVSHPPHYTQGHVECIDAIEAALGPAGFIPYLQGQVMKYIWRFEHKGNSVQDVEKALWYAERLKDKLRARMETL